MAGPGLSAGSSHAENLLREVTHPQATEQTEGQRWLKEVGDLDS